MKTPIKTTQWLRVRGSYPHRWWLRPICFLFKHKYKRVSAYGIVYKQCHRCGKDIFKKRGKTVEGIHNSLRKGEIGQLYGVRFIESNSLKNTP